MADDLPNKQCAYLRRGPDQPNGHPTHECDFPGEQCRPELMCLAAQPAPRLLPPERLEAIWARASKASPGPWTVDKAEVEEGVTFCHVEGWTDNGTEWMDLDEDDAEFIAHARQDIPDLRDHITAQAERIKALEAALRPYARLALVYDGHSPAATADEGVKVGDLRLARTVLKGE